MSFSGELCEGTLIVDDRFDIEDLPTVKDVIFRNKKFASLKNTFQHCNELEHVKFEKCEVTDGNISYLFNDCRNLKTVDMSGLEFNDKPYSAGAFTHCYSLEYIILPLYLRDMHLKFIPFHITKRVACGTSVRYNVKHFMISMKKDKQMFSLIKNKEGTFSTVASFSRKVKQFVHQSKSTREAKIFLIIDTERKCFNEEVTVNEYVDAIEVVVKNKEVMEFNGYVDIIVN